MSQLYFILLNKRVNIYHQPSDMYHYLSFFQIFAPRLSPLITTLSEHMYHLFFCYNSFETLQAYFTKENSRIFTNTEMSTSKILMAYSSKTSTIFSRGVLLTHLLLCF